MIILDTSISKLNKVAASQAKKLKNLGIRTVRDLLYYYPFRYDDFSQVSKISELKPGTKASIQGRVDLISNKRSLRKRIIITEALISDDTGSFKALWFNQPFLTNSIRIGDFISLAGKVDTDFYGIQMKSPSWEKIYHKLENQDITEKDIVHTRELVPIYHLTYNLTQKQIRFVISSVIKAIEQINDWLPEEVRNKYNLIGLQSALIKVHFPDNKNEIEKARRRLKFDELFLIQLQSQVSKLQIQSYKGISIEFHQKPIKQFIKSLPFELTKAQKKAIWEIILDLKKQKPMNRLLEGDVGAGKTIVAVIASYNVILQGYQTILMAPTEILARQHFENISKMLSNFGVKIGLLTKSQRIVSLTPFRKDNKSKKEMLNLIKNGELDFIIGTHALIQKNAKFKNLGLAIVDEQHRFGVEQRKELRSKSYNFIKGNNSKDTEAKKIMPHFLSMSATPIPRSLALVAYGDLDLSILDELPKGRKLIKTFIVPEDKRLDTYNYVREQVKKGKQAFIICPLIEPSDKLGVKSVKEEYKKLKKNFFPDLEIGLLHGKLKIQEKEEIMQKFLANKIKILISTSVVEVGIDAPNANIMIIEGADRFGLAQLHQFRGRLSRGAEQSYCFLFSDSLNASSLERLSALIKSNNGFELAEQDLKFRGPGQIYGTLQAGFSELNIADLSDHLLIKQAKEALEDLSKQDPTFKSWPELYKIIKVKAEQTHLE